MDTRYSERHLNLRLSDPETRGFKEFVKIRGIEAAYREVLIAMEQYKDAEVKQEELRGKEKAKQECIEFLKWAVKNHSVDYEGFSLSLFNNGDVKKFVDGEELTMDEFYNLYITSKNGK